MCKRPGASAVRKLEASFGLHRMLPSLRRDGGTRRGNLWRRPARFRREGQCGRGRFRDESAQAAKGPALGPVFSRQGAERLPHAAPLRNRGRRAKDGALCCGRWRPAARPRLFLKQGRREAFSESPAARPRLFQRQGPPGPSPRCFVFSASFFAVEAHCSPLIIPCGRAEGAACRADLPHRGAAPSGTLSRLFRKRI